MTEYGGTVPHLYVSTACQHGLCSTGMEGEGSRCRDTCKFCGTGCLHECHADGVPDDEILRERLAEAVSRVAGRALADYYSPNGAPGVALAVADAVILALKNVPAGC